MNRSRVLVPVLSLLLSLPLFAQPDRNADHEELRALLRTATQALNARQIDALAPLFARQFVITTVDGRTFRDLAGFKSYIDQLYGAKVQKIEFRPEAAELTQFLDADAGLSWGKSTDTYTFKDGDVRTMTSHWTATLKKEDGRWKVAALHISANVLDNPLIAQLKRCIWIAAAIALLVGLILGFALRALTARRA
jgi:uncharacterized protein (TIGR02246 family)